MSDPTPPKSNPTPPKPLWELDPNDPKNPDALVGGGFGLLQGNAALLAEERRAGWLHARESVKIPPELRQDSAVQSEIIVAAAQDVKVDALRKGMADKYKDAPEIHADANGPEDAATRLLVGGRVVRASKDDVGIVEDAAKEKDQAYENARKAVANTANKLGIKADQVNEITQVLEVEARQNMQGNAPAAAAPKAPERPAPSR